MSHCFLCGERIAKIEPIYRRTVSIGHSQHYKTWGGARTYTRRFGMRTLCKTCAVQEDLRHKLVYGGAAVVGLILFILILLFLATL
jgi:hypothetical protein